ncbi:hypothetical protein [Niallia sp. 01092]|uniref:hypothetical protein n=1 Tax=unclassified Niallia TaxID=2837522 RepID=UPI003FCF02DA
MKKEELEAKIKSIEEKIESYQNFLINLNEELKELIKQEEERKRYISSKEIIDLIYEHTGKNTNMSTIKRWADEGYIGNIINEKDKFWALKSKQGKKRFLYPKEDVYNFLYQKGYLWPKYEVLDRVLISENNHELLTGIIVNSYLKKDEFHYTIQVEGNMKIIKEIKETLLKKLT